MKPQAPHQVTDLLERLRGGDGEAQGLLIEALYPAFKRIAQRSLRALGGRLTLSATELVHEAFLRMEPQQRPQWESREHVIAVVGLVLRRAAVDYLRGRSTEKRGSHYVLRSLEDLPLADLPGGEASDALLDLESALRELADRQPEMAAVAELKLFSGMTSEEIADSCGISVATVGRHWRFARAWLGRRLGGADPLRDD